MKSQTYRKLALCSIVALLGLTVSLNAVDFVSDKEETPILAGSTYSFNLDSASTGVSSLPSAYDTSSHTISQRYTTFAGSGIKKLSGGLFSMKAGSANNAFGNTTPILGLSEIRPTYTGGDVLSLYGATTEGGTYTKFFSFSNASSTTSLSYCAYPYIKFVDETSSDIAVTSIAFTYTCSAKAAITAVTISGNDSGAVSSTTTLTAAVASSSAPQDVTWSSSNTEVATVSSAGVVTALKSGSTTITATSVYDQSVSGTKNFKVTGGVFSIANITGLAVNEQRSLSITYTSVSASDQVLAFSFTYDAIGIYGNATDGYYVIGYRSSETTTVTATTASGSTTTLPVTLSDAYSSNNVLVDSSNVSHWGSSDWYSTAVTPTAISGLQGNTSFVRGVDASEVAVNEEKGAKYYNSYWKETDVFHILHDKGVNCVRLRIWVDPYTTASTPVTYGGGHNDYATTLALALRATRAWMSVCLDFHYSDFWADPDKQVMPKSWSSLSTSDALASKVYTYTKETVAGFFAAGVNLSMVQIGNEITAGILNYVPSSTGADTSVTSNANPNYITNKQSASSSVTGALFALESGNAYSVSNFKKYIAAGISGARDGAGSNTIQVALHYAQSFSTASLVTYAGTFFTQYCSNLSYGGKTVDYDIAGLSYYPYYHGSVTGSTGLTAALQSVQNAVGTSKKVMVLEHAYGYTTWTDAVLDSHSSSISGYTIGEKSCQIQTNMHRDVINALYSECGASSGLFLWASCWTPVTGSGWAGSGSKNTYADQAMFGYNGMVLPTLGAIYTTIFASAS